MREVVCPSGAVLKINPSPFPVAKALYQAFLSEARGLDIDSKTEFAVIAKELLCLGFSSPEIEARLIECFKRCTYNRGGADLKIDNDTFEPVESREDYMTVCMEVAKENIAPFTKSLFAEFQRILAMMAAVGPA